MLGFTFKREAYRHYTGSEIRHWKLEFWGWNLLGWYRSWDPPHSDGWYSRRFYRLGIATMMNFGLFRGNNNYLKGRGWEFWISPMRYWPVRWPSFSVGWSDAKDRRTPYPGSHRIRRLGKLAFCNHNSKVPPPPPPQDPEDAVYADADDYGSF